MEVTYNYDWWKYDTDLIKEFNHFLIKVNERACIQHGFMDHKYQPVDRFGNFDYGLQFDVEWFHPTITLDDRMRFIVENIASSGMSKNNIICNTLISHFYGGRGVHFIISGQKDVFVDFDRVPKDQEYVRHLRSNAERAKADGSPIWGTTELHTSIQTAGRNYCRQLYGDPNRAFHPVDVIEWVASFKDSGLIDELRKADHIEEAYKSLRTLPGIGEYYGFHGAASTSALPMLKYHHDQRFVAPGPGAVHTISQIWPNAPKKLYAEAVYFLREQAEKIGLVDNVYFHPKAYNIGENFSFPQDSLKYYGTEVACCQFSVYMNIRNDPKRCAKRKVARVKEKEETSLESFIT